MILWQLPSAKRPFQLQLRFLPHVQLHHQQPRYRLLQNQLPRHRLLQGQRQWQLEHLEAMLAPVALAMLVALLVAAQSAGQVVFA